MPVQENIVFVCTWLLGHSQSSQTTDSLPISTRVSGINLLLRSGRASSGRSQSVNARNHFYRQDSVESGVVVRGPALGKLMHTFEQAIPGRDEIVDRD